MDTDSPALEQLSRDECMRLMGPVPVGRIVHTRQALPAVEMVNFALVGGDGVIRTSAEGKLAAATRRPGFRSGLDYASAAAADSSVTSVT
jgi:uncharacterized protein